MTYDEARTLGLVRYYTGETCLNGHISERYVSRKRCVECDREKNRQQREFVRELEFSGVRYAGKWRG